MNSLIQKRVAKASYSFAVDGGAATAITPSVTDLIPSGAIINSVTIDSKTAFTSGGSATIALTAGGVTIMAAVAYSASPFSATVPQYMSRTTGAVAVVPYVPIKTLSSAVIAVVIGTVPLTAGVMDIYVEYTFAD